LDLTIAQPELTKRSLTAIKVCLDTNCQVFQNSEFNEVFLQPVPQMGRCGRYFNRRTKTYPCFIHLPGKPALLNLTRVLECKSLFDPRELLEAICKGLTLEKLSLGKGVKEKKQAPSPIVSPIEPQEEETGVVNNPSTIVDEKGIAIVDNSAPAKRDAETGELVDNPPKDEDQDPVEALESLVLKYGEEASAHIGAGMKIFSHRVLLPYQGVGTE